MAEKNTIVDESFLCDNLSFAAKEAYKKLRTNTLLLLGDNDGCKVIGVTSAQPSEGKSLTSVNLAFSLSELDKKVLLIDGDMRRPSIAAKLNKRLAPGLSNLLAEQEISGSPIQKYLDSDGKKRFDVLCSGSVPENPSELLSSSVFKSLLRAIRKKYDYVVIDLPPVGAVIDATEVGKLADGMLVILRENTCSRSMLSSCVKQLELAKIKILGFVMNGSLEGSGKEYQYSNYQ